MEDPEAWCENWFKINLASEPPELGHEILVACRETNPTLVPGYLENPIVLVKWNEKIVGQSKTCRKLARVVKKAEIKFPECILGMELIGETQVIVFIQECMDYFANGYIETINDFYEYIKFADAYDLDIPFICSQTDRIIWLLAIKDRQKDLWRDNEILLKPVEQKHYRLSKFGVVPMAAAGPGPYPVGAGPVKTPFITMKEIPEPKFLSPQEFAGLLEILLRSFANVFVTKMLAVLGPSIEYYHTVISAAKYFRDCHCFNSCLFYAFRLMYLEEISMYCHKRSAGRFIVDLDTAAELPSGGRHAATSPYMVFMAGQLADTTLRSGLMLPAMLPGPRGLYSTKEFKERMNKFTFGMFENFDWSDEYSTSALSGSIMTACAVITPLEQLFDTFEDYLNEYYPCRPTTNNVKPAASIERPITLMYDEDDDSALNLPIPVATKPQIIHDIDYTDIDLMIACEWKWFDIVAERHYKRISANASAAGFDVTMELVKTENKHKYIIKGLPRDIDIFHVDDILPVIVKYHLGAVRAVFDGQRVLCFPSFIIAAMTGMNVDIRWTSNKKDVRDIVMKYFQRGFGTILNQQDKQSLIDYVAQTDDWPSIHPPAGNVWRVRRFWRQPLFHNNYNGIMNPSVSRIGLHKNIQSIPHRIIIPRLDDAISYRKRSGRKSSKQGNANPVGMVCTDVDYKAHGNCVNPFTCSSISMWL